MPAQAFFYTTHSCLPTFTMTYFTTCHSSFICLWSQNKTLHATSIVCLATPDSEQYRQLIVHAYLAILPLKNNINTFEETSPHVHMAVVQACRIHYPNQSILILVPLFLLLCSDVCTPRHDCGVPVCHTKDMAARHANARGACVPGIVSKDTQRDFVRAPCGVHGWLCCLYAITGLFARWRL